MKKHVSVLVVMCVLLGTGGIASAEHLVISANKRLNIDIPLKVLTEAYKRIGGTIELKWYPAERALRAANSGEVDGDIFRIEGIEQDYPNLIRVPVAVYTDDIIVVTKEKIFPVDGWNSLLPYAVGYIRGIKLVEMNIAEGTNTEAVATAEQAYRKLEAGRTDVVVGTRNQAQVTLEAIGLKDLIVLEPPLTTIPFFHYLHVKNRQLVILLTEALRQMEDEGLIQCPPRRFEEAVPSPLP